MSEQKQDRPKIKKIVINSKEYVDLAHLKHEIGMLGAYMLLEGRLIPANAIGSLLAMLDKDIYDTYPKEGESGDDNNIVNLFGDKK